MDIHVLSYPKALEFVPTKQTYAIRIFSTKQSEEFKRPLVNSSLYLHVAQYTFDEEPIEDYKSDPWSFDEIGYTPFTIDTARQMLREFLPFKTKTDALMIHCNAGITRSGSIALAFNDIFKFGHKPEDLSVTYRHRLENFRVRRIPYPWFNDLLEQASKEFPEIQS